MEKEVIELRIKAGEIFVLCLSILVVVWFLSRNQGQSNKAVIALAEAQHTILSAIGRLPDVTPCNTPSDMANDRFLNIRIGELRDRIEKALEKYRKANKMPQLKLSDYARRLLELGLEAEEKKK